MLCMMRDSVPAFVRRVGIKRLIMRDWGSGYGILQ